MNNCISAPNALSHTCRVRREDAQRLEELSEVGHSVGALQESGPQVHVHEHQLLLLLRYVHDCSEVTFTLCVHNIWCLLSGTEKLLGTQLHCRTIAPI